jgi:hypothetical protein
MSDENVKNSDEEKFTIYNISSLNLPLKKACFRKKNIYFFNGTLFLILKRSKYRRL